MSKTATANSSTTLRPRYIRQRDVLQMVPISAASLWRYVKNQTFPAPVKLGPRVTAWSLAEVEAHLAEKAKK